MFIDNLKHEGTSMHVDSKATYSTSNSLSTSTLYARTTHSIQFGSYNVVIDPRGKPLNNSTIDSEPNASSFTYDPGSTSFSNTFDNDDATTTSDHGDHIFDPGAVHFHSCSGPPSPHVPHSIGDYNHIFDPSNILLISSNSSRAFSTNHGRNRSTPPSGNKAITITADGKAVMSPHCLIALTRRPF
jgi:hypothetical protein